jgi:hypothetical protein
MKKLMILLLLPLLIGLKPSFVFNMSNEITRFLSYYILLLSLTLLYEKNNYYAAKKKHPHRKPPQQTYTKKNIHL